MASVEVVTFPISSLAAVEGIYKSLRSAQVAGFKSAIIGPTTEDKNVGKAFAEWRSIDDHIAFEKSDLFKSMGPPEISGIVHWDLDTSPFAQGGPFEKQVIELVESTFPVNAVPPKAEELFRGSGEAMKEGNPKGFGGFTSGWQLEERDDEGVEGGKLKVLAAAMGWDSLEDHVSATKADIPVLKEFMKKFMAEIKAKKTTIYHVERKLVV